MSDQPPAAHARGHTRVQELSRAQTLVARRAAEAKATIPDFSAEVEVDLEAALARLAGARPEDASGDAAPGPADLIVQACAHALRAHPRVNGSYRDGQFELHDRVNVGVAVSGEDLLLVPTIFDADGKDLAELARESRTLAERVRSGAITPPELAGGTFTVHDLRGGALTRHVALITPPQAAALAVGAITARAVVVAGAVAVRRGVSLVLTCDHRILYAADAAAFLETLREQLERP
jgi:pyruvate dehydrogenase E2 component (dihydrolipoamide acetyltransferase)